MEPTTYEELSAQLTEADDVLTVEMRTLRNVHGAERLGQQINQNISNELRKLGIGHVPRELPLLRQEPTRLYRLGTPVGELIEAAVIHFGPPQDQRLRDAAGGRAGEQVARIREIVCD